MLNSSTHVARLCCPGLCKATFSSFALNKLISSVALKVFDEIPETRVPNSSLHNGFYPQFPNKCDRRGREHLVVKDSLKHGNAHEALESFCQLNTVGRNPPESVFCIALNSCSKTLNVRLGSQIHARIIRAGYEDNLYLGTALVDLYVKYNALVDAIRVFDGMGRHDQVSWTSLISGFSQNGHGREAILMFKEMLSSNSRPNSFTYVGVISACTGLEPILEQLVLLHAHVIVLGLQTNSYVVSSLIDCYSKDGRVHQAALLFRASIERDNIILNSMISGYAHNGCCEDALKLFVEMRKDGLDPTGHTLTSVLNACGSLTVIQQGKQVHSLIIKLGSDNSKFVASALIDMYSKCGNIDEGPLIFDQTSEKNGILWTALMTGYAQNSRGLDALQLFEHLVTERGFMPDHVCFTAVLTACNHSGFLDKGVEYFTQMKGKFGLVPQIDQYAVLIDLHTRNGHLRKAKELMEEMPYDPNPIMWSSFLSSCKVYGEVELGKEAADRLFKLEESNAAPYATMANIYAEAGIWGKVAEIWRCMKRKGIKKAAGWSWVEVDNRINIFSATDASHPRSHEIYWVLEKLNLEMESGYIKLDSLDGEGLGIECLIGKI